jgi:hypothetical protein
MILHFPISNKLQAVHDKVLAGNFLDDKVTPRISFSKYLEWQVRLKRQRVALARRDVIKDVDVKKGAQAPQWMRVQWELSLVH